MKLAIAALLVASTLTGCATGQSEYYAVEKERHITEGKRWEAMGKIAESGDTTVKTVAMVTMGAAAHGSSAQATAAPRSPVDTLLQAAGIFVPAIVQGYGIRANSQVNMRQSDNAAATAISTNNAFVGIASKIQAPQAPQANVSNMTSTTSNTTSSTTSNTDSHAIAGSYNPANVTTSTDSSYNPISTPTSTTTTDNSQRTVPVTPAAK